MKLHKILIALFSAAVISSCTNGFEDMNRDPLAVNEISPDLSLPKMQYHGFHIVYGDYQRAALLYSFLYCQYMSNTSSSLHRATMFTTPHGRNADCGIPTIVKW